MNVFCGAQAIRDWGSPTSSLTLTAEVAISEDYKWHVNLNLMGSDTGPITAVGVRLKVGELVTLEPGAFIGQSHSVACAFLIETSRKSTQPAHPLQRRPGYYVGTECHPTEPAPIKLDHLADDSSGLMGRLVEHSDGCGIHANE